MKDAAIFSPDQTLRYWLTRVNLLPNNRRTLVIIGANPSTATADTDDRTIAKEIKFARAWRFGLMIKINAYAYRATDPDDMWLAQRNGRNIVGVENDGYIIDACSLATRVMVAWGKIAKPERVREIVRLLDAERVVPYCWNENQDGSPTHPLYQPDTTKPRPWNMDRWRATT